MAAINILGFEIDIKDIIKGTVIFAGAATLLVGIKKIVDVKDVDFEIDELEDDDPEYNEILLEEYKESERIRLRKKRNCKLFSGLISIVSGAAAVAAGVISFTPYNAKIKKKVSDNINEDIKKLLFDAELLRRVKNIDAVSKIKDIDAISKIKDMDTLSKIKELDAISKIKDMDTLSKIKDMELVSKFIG